MDGSVHLKSDVLTAVNAVEQNMFGRKECDVEDRRVREEEGKKERKGAKREYDIGT